MGSGGSGLTLLARSKLGQVAVVVALPERQRLVSVTCTKLQTCFAAYILW